MTRIIATVSAPLLVYLCAAFISLEFDPTDWTAKGRFVFVSVSAWVGFMVAIHPGWEKRK